MGSALKEWMVPWSSLERVAVSPGLVVREMAVPRDGGAASLSLPVRWPRMGSWLSFFPLHVLAPVHNSLRVISLGTFQIQLEE